MSSSCHHAIPLGMGNHSQIYFRQNDRTVLPAWMTDDADGADFPIPTVFRTVPTHEVTLFFTLTVGSKVKAVN